VRQRHARVVEGGGGRVREVLLGDIADQLVDLAHRDARDVRVAADLRDCGISRACQWGMAGRR